MEWGLNNGRECGWKNINHQMNLILFYTCSHFNTTTNSFFSHPIVIYILCLVAYSQTTTTTTENNIITTTSGLLVCVSTVYSRHIVHIVYLSLWVSVVSLSIYVCLLMIVSHREIENQLARNLYKRVAKI